MKSQAGVAYNGRLGFVMVHGTTHAMIVGTIRRLDLPSDEARARARECLLATYPGYKLGWFVEDEHGDNADIFEIYDEAGPRSRKPAPTDR